MFGGADMAGCRALTDEEIKDVAGSFHGRFKARNKALFILGVRSGFRLSELLSLRVRDVFQRGGLVDLVTVERRAMKGKRRSRTVPLHSEAKAALANWLLELGADDPDAPVFKLSTVGAWKALRAAFDDNALSGHVSTHSMRKSFARRVYDKLGHDLPATARALGHASVQSTISYLAVDDDKVNAAIMAA